MTRLPPTQWRGGWVLARRIQDGFDGQGLLLWHWEYWTGEHHEDGRPKRTLWRSDAHHFSSSSAAVECANTHRELKDSDEWRAIPARPRESSHRSVAFTRQGAKVLACSNGGR